MKVYNERTSVRCIEFCCFRIYREFEKGNFEIFFPYLDRDTERWRMVVRWNRVEIDYCPFCGAPITNYLYKEERGAT